jgi:hypothetical protein
MDRDDLSDEARQALDRLCDALVADAAAKARDWIEPMLNGTGKRYLVSPSSSEDGAVKSDELTIRLHNVPGRIGPVQFRLIPPYSAPLATRPEGQSRSAKPPRSGLP